MTKSIPLGNILEEPKMKLYEDPLSSAEDIEIFKENLTYLRNLKMEREKTLSELRAHIANLSKELDLPILEEPLLRFDFPRLHVIWMLTKIVFFFPIPAQPLEELWSHTIQVQYRSAGTIGKRSKATEGRTVWCRFQSEEKIGNSVGLLGSRQKCSQEIQCIHRMFAGKLIRQLKLC